MGLIKCPDCEKEISDTATVCIGCGRTMVKLPVAKSNMGVVLVVVLAVVLVVAGILFYKSTQSGSQREKIQSPEQAWADAKSSLNALRASIQIYYGDNKKYPAKLEALSENKKYIDEIPYIQLPGHIKTNSVWYRAADRFNQRDLTDSGGWVYYISTNGKETDGMIMFDCTHRDHAGKPMWDY